MPRVLGRTIFGFLLFGMLGQQVVTGIQTAVPPDAKSEVKSSRKLKSGQPPEYPELARQMNIKGMARVMVTIAPDGVVKEVKEIGGHPLLIDALVRAVKKWKYEPAAKESVIEVKAEFGAT
jgi:TonB family protein